MDKIKELTKKSVSYIVPFLKWILLGCLMGAIGGVLGAVFHRCLEQVTEIRINNTQIILFLPVAGVLIVWLYRVFKYKGRLNTNGILEAARKDEKVPIILAPLVFIGTLLTHLFGGSAGREGAALQLGGSIGYNIGKILKLEKSDRRIIVMVGMSSFFAAMFGAPLTAAVFSIEVISVGYVRHYALLPCVVSSLVASEIAKIMGAEGVNFFVSVPQISIDVLFKTVVLSVLCAWVSILFCQAIKHTSHSMRKILPNDYLRAAVGALVVVGLTALFRTTDYNGAGMHVISRAIGGKTEWFAFFVKIVFTAITIAAGFKGGEIVPTLFIGATFGCFVGNVIGLDASFAASVGLVALFCGVVNCPFASMVLALELFGADGMLLYALACAVSFMMSGNYSLYKSQKFIFSKISDEKVSQTE